MLKEVRDKYIDKIVNLLSRADISVNLNDSEILLQVILDSSAHIKPNSFPDVTDKIELYSRSLIYKLHVLHTQLMSTIVS